MSAFVSYSHPDRRLARRFAQTLSVLGLTHWWDERISLSTPWSAELEQRLAQASSVAVLWTETSSASEWVRREAKVGLARSKLVQIRFGQAGLPAVFASLQAAEVPTWEENTYPRGIRLALNRIAELQDKPHVLEEHLQTRGLKLSEAKVSKFVESKKHHEGYFPRLDGTLYKDIWEMLMGGEIKLYDELRPGSRQGLDEERYYELIQYLAKGSSRA